MITAHFEALKERLEDHPGLAGKVRDTAWIKWSGDEPVYERTNYVILFGGVPVELGGDRHAKAQILDDDAVFDYTARAVGTSPTAVRTVLAAVFEQFFEWTPDIPGRRCMRLRYPASQQPDVRPDNSVRPPLFYADSEWSLRSFRINSGS